MSKILVVFGVIVGILFINFAFSNGDAFNDCMKKNSSEICHFYLDR